MLIIQRACPVIGKSALWSYLDSLGNDMEIQSYDNVYKC